MKPLQLPALAVLATLLACPPQMSATDPQKTTGSAPQLSVYLLLDGTCRPAMEFYQGILGGELTFTEVGNSPMKNYFPATMHPKIVHARLVGPMVDLSASDWLRPTQTPIPGNTVCLYLSGGKPEELKVIFQKLSQEGNVTDPLKEQPFGWYGALNDKFGVRWMFAAEKP